jgi:hypothetical protein
MKSRQQLRKLKNASSSSEVPQKEVDIWRPCWEICKLKLYKTTGLHPLTMQQGRSAVLRSTIFFINSTHITIIHCKWYSRQNDSRSSKICEVWHLVAIHWFFKLQKNPDCTGLSINTLLLYLFLAHLMTLFQFLKKCQM